MPTELFTKEFYICHICLLLVDWLNRVCFNSPKNITYRIQPNKLLKYSKLWSNILPYRGLWQEKTLGNKQLSSKEEYRTWKDQNTELKLGQVFVKTGYSAVYRWAIYSET
jgi:hypothetical protein